ncbi:MAG TPA: tetrahydrofolate dehydrogenase/cyclohydrolase catalytic domain-containing protein, partial [Spirochaetota bacterium]|nr:tetrahydrofolate dehydrogenase/cyclohydrolase catalytic domain-containing protein [Spirochaetota bacterium]
MEHTLLKLSNISDIITSEIKEIISKNSLKIKIVNIMVGEDVSTLSYLRGMQKKAINIGITLEIINLPNETDENTFLLKLSQLNKDDSIHGIIIQTPLPKHIDAQKVLDLIVPEKDVDGFHPVNAGKLAVGAKDAFYPC